MSQQSSATDFEYSSLGLSMSLSATPTVIAGHFSRKPKVKGHSVRTCSSDWTETPQSHTLSSRGRRAHLPVSIFNCIWSLHYLFVEANRFPVTYSCCVCLRLCMRGTGGPLPLRTALRCHVTLDLWLGHSNTHLGLSRCSQAECYLRLRSHVRFRPNTKTHQLFYVKTVARIIVLFLLLRGSSVNLSPTRLYTLSFLPPPLSLSLSLSLSLCLLSIPTPLSLFNALTLSLSLTHTHTKTKFVLGFIEGHGYSQSGSAYKQCCNAYSQSGSAYKQCCNAYSQSGSAYKQCCNAYSQSGSAHKQCCNAYSQSGSAHKQCENGLFAEHSQNYNLFQK